jgi:hypothetical protein
MALGTSLSNATVESSYGKKKRIWSKVGVNDCSENLKMAYIPSNNATNFTKQTFCPKLLRNKLDKCNVP